MKNIPTTILLTALAAGAVSCGSYQKTDYFLIDTRPAVAAGGETFPYSLAVAEVSAPSRYRERMVFRTSHLEAGYYENSRWMETPSDMVRAALINILQASGLFKQVADRELLPQPNLILRASILNFDQVIEGKKNFAECALDFHLFSAKDPRLLWSYTSRIRLPQSGPGLFADTMSRAVTEAIEKALFDLSKNPQLKTLASEKVSD